MHNIQAEREHSEPPIGDLRTFDNRLNVWTEGVATPVDCRIGSTIGHQSSCGFINYIDFTLPIQRITACLGSHKGRVRGDISGIVGVKFDFKGRPSGVLGRCTTLGPAFNIDHDDKIVEVDVGLGIDGKTEFVDEIIFQTRAGVRKGFKAGNLVTTAKASNCTNLKSSAGMDLVGITWAFGFGFNPTGDHCIRPLY